MTGTVDIQELKRLAEASHDIYSGEAWFSYKEIMIKLRPDEEDAAYIAAASPSTILALIEVCEAAKGILAHAGIADADPSDVDEEDRALERRLRTALEGAKP